MLPVKIYIQIICIFFINSFSKIICSSETETTIELIKMAEATKLYACDFEVYGKVQGVFFRKFTEKRAKILGIGGWCMNTAAGTVKGQLEGSLNKINEMKYWLQNTGSPKSRIDKAIFTETKPITEYNFKTFSIKR